MYLREIKLQVHTQPGACMLMAPLCGTAKQNQPRPPSANERKLRELSPHSGMFKNIGASWRRGKGKEDRGPRVELFTGVRCLERTKRHRWEPVVTVNCEGHWTRVSFLRVIHILNQTMVTVIQLAEYATGCDVMH